MTTTIGAAWRLVRDRFAAAGLGNAALDARLLAERAFGLDHAGLVAHERDVAAPDALVRLEALAVRRMAGQPVARILGFKEFFGLEFAVGPGTLVPRPETELVVETVLTWQNAATAERVLDLGTGSGAIAVAILHALPHLQAVGVDLDPGALETARANARKLGVGDRFEARQGSWFTPIGSNERFDVIVSNPPYVESGVIPGLDREVRDHDPALALDGGVDGLDAYRAILSEAATHLRGQGLLVFEIGADQGEAVARLVAEAGFAQVEIHQDLAGHDRVVSAMHLW